MGTTGFLYQSRVSLRKYMTEHKSIAPNHNCLPIAQVSQGLCGAFCPLTSLLGVWHPITKIHLSPHSHWYHERSTHLVPWPLQSVCCRTSIHSSQIKGVAHLKSDTWGSFSWKSPFVRLPAVTGLPTLLICHLTSPLKYNLDYLQDSFIKVIYKTHWTNCHPQYLRQVVYR